MRALAGLLSICCAFALLVACGGGGDDRLSEAAYFERVEALVNAASPEISLSSDGIDVFDLEEGRPQLAERYQSAADRTEALAADLADLNPPQRFESLHAEYVDAVNDLVRVITALSEGTADVSKSPSGEVFEAVTIAYDQVLELSSVIETAATERGITIELAWRGGDVGGQTVDIAPGIRGEFANMPPLPDGLVALTQYIEFEVGGENIAATIGLPLQEAVEDASSVAFYSYEGGEWVRLDVRVRPEQEGSIASGDFEAVPASLAVLREE